MVEIQVPPQLTPELVAWYEQRVRGRDTPAPALDVPWFMEEVALYLGISVDSGRVYRERANRADRTGTRKPGHLPKPDGKRSRGMWWWPATIIGWDKYDRPRQGTGGGKPPIPTGVGDLGKVLSVKQYWAWAILHAGKGIENRSWSTNYRGRVWIHAGGNIDRYSRPLLQHLVPEGIAIPDNPTRSVLLGHVQLVDVVRDAPSRWAEPGDVWHWVIEDPVPLDEPIPMPGALRLFNLPDNVEAQLKAMGVQPAGSIRTSV